MAKKIDELSAEELFALAKQKEQAEREEAEREATKLTRISEIGDQMDALISKHERAISTCDQEIEKLTNKRQEQIAEHERILKEIDRDISRQKELRPKIVAEHESKIHSLEKELAELEGRPANSASKVIITEDSDPLDRLYNKIVDIMRNRKIVSSALLMDKLKNRGVDLRLLNRQLEQLVKDGRLAMKGNGNYTLGKK